MPQTILSLTELTCLITYVMEPVQSLTVLCMKIGQLCLQVQVQVQRLNYWIIPSEILGKKVSMSLGSLTLCIDKLYRKITQCSVLQSFLIFVWNRSGFLFFLLVSDLPTSSLWGAVALPTLTGDGVIVQHGQYFSQLNCNASTCKWNILEKELSLYVYSAFAMILPAEYTCE